MTTHVIGAGIAGLAAALAMRGPVVVHEAAPLAGGRARALADGLDNGTHALVGANRAALGFLREIGARADWVEPEPGGLPVLDLADGRARRVALSPLGWWRAAGRPDGLTPAALAALARLAGPGDVAVGPALSGHPAFLRGFVEPLVMATLNTPVAEASSRRLGAVLRRVGAPGAARLLVARRGLGPDLVEPALAALRARGATLRHGARLRGLAIGADDRPTALDFADGTLALGEGDGVILAVPPWEAARLLPGLPVPAEHAPILNLHFAHAPPGPVRFLGVLGGLCQWVLVRPASEAGPGSVAVTVSAADAESREAGEALAPRAWAEIRALAAAFGLPGEWPETPPPCRAVKERRATPRHRPGDPKPPPVLVLPGVALAGDWMEPVLPATIDAAVRAGRRAAKALG